MQNNPEQQYQLLFFLQEKWHFITYRATENALSLSGKQT